MCDQPMDGVEKVAVVDPGDELSSVAVGTTESAIHEIIKDFKDAAGIRAEGDGGSEEDEPSVREFAGEGRCFPGFGDINAEVPGVGGMGFASAEDAVFFIVGGIVAVCVDGGGGGEREPRMASPTMRVDLMRESLISRRLRGW